MKEEWSGMPRPALANEREVRERVLDCFRTPLLRGEQGERQYTFEDLVDNFIWEGAPQIGRHSGGYLVPDLDYKILKCDVDIAITRHLYAKE